MSTDTVLQTCDLRMAFGGLKIFDKLNFSMRRGERHAVIGPNGAGKSTFVNLDGPVEAHRRQAAARGP